jgi:plastocyanin
MKYLNAWFLGIVTWSVLALGATPSFAAQALANETVSFGQWEPPLDRLTANPGGGVGNVHELAPNVVTIKAGGAVNFIISGLHNVQVYDDGTQPEDIGTAPPVVQPPGQGGGIIDVPTNRIYRGWDPNTVPNTFARDRVEVVHFAEPGVYLVICGVRNHFVDDDMFGFVRVLPDKPKGPDKK